MDQKHLLKRVAKANKISLNNAFDAMALFQDQSTRFAKAALDQAEWLPDESRKAAEAWIEAVHCGQKNIKKQINDGYEKIERLFIS